MLKKKKLQSQELKDLVFSNKMLLDYYKICQMQKNVQNINLRKIYQKRLNELI
jgi:hypothetical protein